MPYATREDVRSVYETSGPEGTAASLSDSRLDEILAESEAQINAVLSTRYDVPITVEPTPALLRHITLAYATYAAVLDFRGTKDLEDRDPHQLRYNAARQMLDDIIGYRANLPVPEASGGAGEVYNQIDEVLFDLDDFDLNKVYNPTRDVRRGERWWFHRA